MADVSCLFKLKGPLKTFVGFFESLDVSFKRFVLLRGARHDGFHLSRLVFVAGTTRTVRSAILARTQASANRTSYFGAHRLNSNSFCTGRSKTIYSQMPLF